MYFNCVWSQLELKSGDQFFALFFNHPERKKSVIKLYDQFVWHDKAVHPFYLTSFKMQSNIPLINQMSTKLIIKLIVSIFTSHSYLEQAKVKKKIKSTQKYSVLVQYF